MGATVSNAGFDGDKDKRRISKSISGNGFLLLGEGDPGASVFWLGRFGERDGRLGVQATFPIAMASLDRLGGGNSHATVGVDTDDTGELKTEDGDDVVLSCKVKSVKKSEDKDGCLLSSNIGDAVATLVND